MDAAPDPAPDRAAPDPAAPDPVAPAPAVPVVTDPAQLRASDVDRNRVAEQLHTAAAEGRLTMDELAERLDVVYAAKTYADLVPVTRDLPGAPGVLVPHAGAAVDMRKYSTPAAGTRSELTQLVPGAGPEISVAVLGGSARSGNWVVPEQHTAIAFLGGVDLDLREARFAAPVVTITAVAVMGGVVIVVPHDLTVEVEGFAFMGGFERHGAGERPAGPRLRVTGFALMGGVEVKRADPPGLDAGATGELTA